MDNDSGSIQGFSRQLHFFTNANLAFLIEQKKLTDNPEQKNVTYIGIERVI